MVRYWKPMENTTIVIEMGDDSNAFIKVLDQSLGKFVVSRTNATGSSTGNLVHNTAPLVANLLIYSASRTLQRLLILQTQTLDSADITTF